MAKKRRSRTIAKRRTGAVKRAVYRGARSAGTSIKSIGIGKAYLETLLGLLGIGAALFASRHIPSSSAGWKVVKYGTIPATGLLMAILGKALLKMKSEHCRELIKASNYAAFMRVNDRELVPRSTKWDWVFGGADEEPSYMGSAIDEAAALVSGVYGNSNDGDLLLGNDNEVYARQNGQWAAADESHRVGQTPYLREPTPALGSAEYLREPNPQFGSMMSHEEAYKKY